jgi:hypothetical protein
MSAMSNCRTSPPARVRLRHVIKVYCTGCCYHIPNCSFRVCLRQRKAIGFTVRVSDVQSVPFSSRFALPNRRSHVQGTRRRRKQGGTFLCPKPYFTLFYFVQRATYGDLRQTDETRVWHLVCYCTGRPQVAFREMVTVLKTVLTERAEIAYTQCLVPPMLSDLEPMEMDAESGRILDLRASSWAGGCREITFLRPRRGSARRWRRAPCLGNTTRACSWYCAMARFMLSIRLSSRFDWLLLARFGR